MEQEEEFHQARLAALKQPTPLEHTSTAKADEPGESYNLPEGSGTLELDLPGLARRDLYDIWKGSFRPENLARLRVHSGRPDLSDVATIENGKLISKRPTTSRKVYENKEVWFTGFTNYVVIVSTLCVCPTNLHTRMLLWMNKIRDYSATYNWTSILDLTLDYYGYVMDRNQLEPSNWDMPTQFEAAYCRAANMKAWSQGIEVRGIASKRSRKNTSPPLPPNKLCYSWNNQ